MTELNQALNIALAYVLWGSLGFVALVVIIVRLGWELNARQRLISTLGLSANDQTFWKRPAWSLSPWIKQHLLYAPLWRKRHSKKFYPLSRREKGFGSRISFGALPTRIHVILISLLVLTNAAYMFMLPWERGDKVSLYTELRGRSGTLATANLIPLVLFASRNNPLIRILSINFDTFNLMHRWIGRVAVSEVAIHTVAWVVVKVWDGGWHSVIYAVRHDLFILSGTIGTFVTIVLMFQSASPLRSAFYETFLNVHIVLAVVSIACGWIHVFVATKPVPHLRWIIAAATIWFVERLARLARLFYFNWSGRRMSDAVVECMPGSETCRVTMTLPRHVEIRPGSHAYIRISGARRWECHPFSIAWVEHKPRDSLPTTLGDEKTTSADGSTTISFLVGARTGFTRRLYDDATSAASDEAQAISTRAFFEGPYGGIHCLDSYGHVLLFAGATGITHQLSFVQHLVAGFHDRTVSTRRVVLVWAVRDLECLEWIWPWLETIFGLPRAKEILHVRIHVTRQQPPQQQQRRIASSHRARQDPALEPAPCRAEEGMRVKMGRPDVGGVIAREVRGGRRRSGGQIGAMVVQVCGPGELADDVRMGVRRVQRVGNVVDFIEESFSW